MRGRASKYGIYTEVRLRDRALTMLVNTGCGTTALDEEFEPQLGEPRPLIVQTGGSTSPRAKMFFNSPSLEWSGRPLGLPGVASGSFEIFERLLEIPIHGFLGMDALSPQVLQVDFARGRWERLPPRTQPPETMVHVPLRERGGCPLVDIRPPDGTEAEFALDTGLVGFSSGNMDEDLLRSLAAAGRASLLQEGLSRDGPGPGLRRVKIYRVTLQIGSLKVPDVLVSAADQNNLGAAFLSRFTTVRMDFPGKSLGLVAGPNLTKPDIIDRSGLQLGRSRKELVVTYLWEGGPAVDAGVELGDIVHSIDGKPAELLGLLAARESLAGPIAGSLREDPATLVLTRKGKELEARIPLNVWPQPKNYKRLP